MTDIKPLVWTLCEDKDGDGGEMWEAKTPFGWIIVFKSRLPASPTWTWNSMMHAGNGYLTLEAAKNAARRWWEAAVSECRT